MGKKMKRGQPAQSWVPGGRSWGPAESWFPHPLPTRLCQDKAHGPAMDVHGCIWVCMDVYESAHTVTQRRL